MSGVHGKNYLQEIQRDEVGPPEDHPHGVERDGGRLDQRVAGGVALAHEPGGKRPHGGMVPVGHGRGDGGQDDRVERRGHLQVPYSLGGEVKKKSN